MTGYRLVRGVDILMGVLGAIGGLIAGLAIQFAWATFLVVSVYTVALVFGTTESARFGVTAFLVAGFSVLLVHLVVGIVPLLLIGTKFWMSAIAAVLGHVLAVAWTLLLTIGFDALGRITGVALSLIPGPLLIFSAGFPVLIALLMTRAKPLTGCVFVALAMLLLIGFSLSSDVSFNLMVLIAWILLPGIGGLTGGRLTESPGARFRHVSA